MNCEVKSARAPSRAHRPHRPRPAKSGRWVATLFGVAVVAFLCGFATQRLARPAKQSPAEEAVAPPSAAAPLPNPAPPAVAARVAVAPAPRPVVSASEPLAVAPAPQPGARIETHPAPGRFAVHTLPVRLDPRKAEDLERDLLGMREVALENTKGQPLATQLVAETKKKPDSLAPAVLMAAAYRHDLAGLPFRTGTDAVLTRDRAEAMNTMSRQLRGFFQKSRTEQNDPRPDIEKLAAALTADGRKAEAWATPESVPCIQQVMQAEGQPVRRLSCDLLRELPVSAAGEALVRWAVFDTDAEVRAAAVDALRGRDRAEVTRLLVPYLRYPWPRAVEHACEALVALRCRDAVPHLAAAYTRPDPDAAFMVDLPGQGGAWFRREVVRVNHLKNCLLCHAPSVKSTDLIQAAVPDQTRPLPSPNSPSYYNSGSTFLVTAGTTYLRQDFSVTQPVASPGPWPAHQRFDYMVAVRRTDTLPPLVSTANSTYRRAVGVALRELTDSHPDLDAAWLREQSANATPASDSRLGEAARAEVLASHPAALLAVRKQEFTRPPIRMTGRELHELVRTWQKVHGAPATRLALVAYLDPLTRDPDPAAADRAARLLAAVRGAKDDHAVGWDLWSAMPGSD